MTENSKKKYWHFAHAALCKKALNLVILEVKEISSFTDYFIVCSGKSSRQVKGIADFIKESLKKEGIYPLGTEGFPEGKWILLDYGDVIIHIFYEPVRDFYDLEGLWDDAPRTVLEKTTLDSEPDQS